jgi:hypothetical protein
MAESASTTESFGARRRTARQFVLDWMLLVVLVAVYELLRDVVPLIGAPRHYLGWIDIDVFGGHLPSLWLQANFYRGSIDWEDTAATSVYFAYYVVPLLVGLLWWFKKRNGYFRYAAALLTLCGMAFMTYIVMPTVPPWLAYPQTIHEITDATIRGWNLPAQVVAVYLDHDYNLFAAFPSLHAALPVILMYYGWLRSRVLGIGMALYAAMVWVSIVFLGEHYVVDIVGGVVYALIAITGVETFARRGLGRRPRGDGSRPDGVDAAGPVLRGGVEFRSQAGPWCPRPGRPAATAGSGPAGRGWSARFAWFRQSW